MGVLVESLRCEERHEVSVRNHGALRWASCSRGVGKCKAIIRMNFELLSFIVNQILLPDCPQLRIGNELNTLMNDIIPLYLNFFSSSSVKGSKQMSLLIFTKSLHLSSALMPESLTKQVVSCACLKT